jgi:hypothetical protein
MVNLLKLDHYGWLALGALLLLGTHLTLGLAEHLERIHLAAIGFGAVGWPDEANAGEGP